MASLRSIRGVLRAPAQARPQTLAPRQPFLSPANIQAFHSSPRSKFPYKDDQDRESLKPKSTEGSKSGTDDAAAQSDAAFDPSTTSPEGAKEQAEGEGHGEPLEVSGASHEKSKPLGNSGGGEMQGTTKQENKKSSHGHSPEKKGKV
ncbi:hypothetical protein J7T55_004442 [Diaporthe amygdali]|uniref:uncharacterized protein n=1 Tax=Phomopsis amygdali TaxID=1214568 RepID=UPI0022FEE6C2|nr:uncharacterized protein J7T55_004442 [Diaporthe amygdali]KAJ0109892.1 hypothetical protein J7T55_004442 [Diaporthe amygdali]